MCEIPGEKMDAATANAVAEARAMKLAMDQVDRFFAPHVARAEALADKIHRAAELCRDEEREGQS